MSDSKLLLVKCITLLFREHERGQSSSSIELCRSVVDSIPLPEASLEVNTGRGILIGLRSTILWLMELPPEEPLDVTQLLQRIRINCQDETYLYDAVYNAIQPINNPDAIQTQILSYRRYLREYLDSIEIKNIVSQYFQKISFEFSNIDSRAFVRDLNSKLEPYTHDPSAYKHPSIVDSVNLEQAEEVIELLTRSKDELSLDGIIKTGYQGINRMLDCHGGGFRRGEMVVVGALQHNYKTGFTLNLFKHAALYNTPYMRDPKKKPMLLHISLENELPMNIMSLYANLKENETHEPCDIDQIRVDEASQYIREKMSVNGYHIEMLRIEPSKCTYHDFFDIIMGYENKGYEIHLIVCDYLSMMDKRGLVHGPAGVEIRDLYRRVRNFTAPRGITFITPHQLSTEAKNKVRERVDNLVQEIANKGYYEGCKQIDQEVDLEITIHIEKVKGQGSFLTCQRGKHRAVKITPASYLYTVLPFHDIGAIRDDYGKADLSRKSITAMPMSDGGMDWYDM